MMVSGSTSKNHNKFKIILKPFLLLAVVSSFTAIFYLLRIAVYSQTCFTVAQIQADTRCLYILSNKVFQKGTRTSPHKGHPCGMDVTSIIPSFHQNSPALYLDPNYKGNLCTTLPTNTPIPTRTPTRTPTRSPTPTRLPSLIPTSTRIPTITIRPSVTLTPTPLPTALPSSARIRFKIRIPDIIISNVSASDVNVEIKDGLISDGTNNVGLVKNGNYYQTVTEAYFNIGQSKVYDLYLKSKTSIRRKFAGVYLIPGQILDCINTIVASCGELVTKLDIKQLNSGDSDGFTVSSGSYNKIDSADLQKLAIYFNQPISLASSYADFNIDNQININDLEILGRNYGLQGE